MRRERKTAAKRERKQKRARRKVNAKLAKELVAVQFRRAVYWPTKACDHPGIEGYRDEEEAWQLLEAIARKRALYVGGPNPAARAFEVVDCACGFWHVATIYRQESAS